MKFTIGIREFSIQDEDGDTKIKNIHYQNEETKKKKSRGKIKKKYVY